VTVALPVLKKPPPPTRSFFHKSYAGSSANGPMMSSDAFFSTAHIDPAALAGRHIFIVDDDTTSLVVLTRVLARAGAEVRGFLLPRELLMAVRDEPSWADVILSDISMPEIDGFGVLAEVESAVPRLRGKVIAATAHASEGEIKRITEAGFVACLTKPLVAPKVVSVVSNVLGGAAAPAE
jgi:CheY-like chemotaxis protein